MKDTLWIKNYMRRCLMFYFFFLGLFTIYPRDFLPLGIGISIPGAFDGVVPKFPSFLFSDDPRASTLNPASMANRKLPVFGFSLVPSFSIDQPTDSSIYIAGCASAPTPFGTTTLLIDGGDSGFGFTGASFFMGISKRSSSNLAFGLGFGGAFLSADKNAYGMNASIGSQISFPELGWGGSELAFALLALGSPISPISSSAPIIAPTPLITLSSSLMESRDFSFSLAVMAGMPNFNDIYSGFALSFEFGNYVDMALGWSFSSSNMPASTTQNYFQLIPSISLNIDASSFLQYSSYGTSLAFAWLNNHPDKQGFDTTIFFSKGKKDNIGPKLVVNPLKADAFSSHSDLSINIPLTIFDSSRIAAWNLNVYDSEGNNVFKVGDGTWNDTDSNGLFSIKQSVKPPVSVQMPLTGKLLDGDYRVRAWAIDEWGNESRSGEEIFQIDSTPPEARVEIEGKIFTPNGDGIHDQITILQEGSLERLWIGTFQDEKEQPARTYFWNDSPPISFSWDGKNNLGETVPDGNYSYTLKSTDAASNNTSLTFSPIMVDSRLSIVNMFIDSNVLQFINDNSFKPLIVTIDVPIKEDLLEWKFELRSADDSVFIAWFGSREHLDILPSSIIFDGRNADGELIPDGSYYFHAQLIYSNGNTPYSKTSSFIVDRTKPEGRIRSNSTLFFPDRGDIIFLYHDLSPNSEWVGTIFDSNGIPVMTYPLGKTMEPVCEWYGLSASGDPVEDGTYSYSATGTSPSGISGSTAAITIKVESSGVDLSLMADKKLFSTRIENGGVRFIPRLEKRERIISYKLGIHSFPEKKLVRAFIGFGLPPGSILWNGYDATGERSLDGEYTAELILYSDGGVETRSAPIMIQLDSTNPKASLKLSSKIFSPNADGKLDSIEILQTAEQEDLWEGYILNEHDLIARAYSWNDIPPSSITWDGRDEKGAIFPDGKYRYRLYSIDSAGNQGLYETVTFTLDARSPRVSIQIDKTIFSPNGDSFADVINIRVSPTFIDGLTSWRLTIIDSLNVPVRILESSGNILADKRWDGRRMDGSVARDGIYKARIDLDYEKGDWVSFDSNAFRIDTTPPSVSVNLYPLPFSPDEDNENDELVISLHATDESPIASWFMNILDPEGYPFTVFAGSTLPVEPIYWDGRDLDGNLVEAAQEYSYELSVRDVLGNSTRSAGIIPIDVFVLRDGDRLKIRISSIVFAPNTAEMLTADLGSSNKNNSILDRIAIVLAKFPLYRVRVEGHAVNISGTEREERFELEPLSLARAQAVSDALVERGVPRKRLESRGLGGREPLVPHGDLQNRWRNRRVEFILVR